MKLRFTSLALLVALLGAFLATPLSTAAQDVSADRKADSFTEIPVKGDVRDGGDFTGTLDIERFDKQGGDLVAIGSLSGILRDSEGNREEVKNERVELPVRGQGTCRILTLELGPLDLNLLGLRVQLNRINLRITAEQGRGNLLGNLLCDIAGLLDDNDVSNKLVKKLNRVVRIVG